MTNSPPDIPGLLAAYAASELTVMLSGGPCTVSPGRKLPPELPTPAGAITAENPGRLQTAELNARASRALLAFVTRHDLAYLPCRSAARDGSHGETGIYLPGIDRGFIQLVGRAFGQVAVYWLDSDGMQVVRCR